MARLSATTALLLLTAMYSQVQGQAYQAVTCVGRNIRANYSGSSGTLGTSRYGANADCRFNITVPENKIPLLSLETIDIRRNRRRCADDLRFYDQAGAATYHLCGSSKNPQALSKFKFTSGDRTLIVRILSDGFNNGFGFTASWKAKDYGDVLCEGVKHLSGSSGRLSSNPGAFTYVNNARCSWSITVPQGKRARLTFQRGFYVASPDYVAVYNGPSSSSPRLMKQNGRLRRAFPVTATGRHIFVNFYSNYIGAVNGFVATYEAV